MIKSEKQSSVQFELHHTKSEAFYIQQRLVTACMQMEQLLSSFTENDLEHFKAETTLCDRERCTK